MDDRERHEYYVDGETGKDSNPGTVDKPMKTISGVADKIERDSFFTRGRTPGQATPRRAISTYESVKF